MIYSHDVDNSDLSEVNKQLQPSQHEPLIIMQVFAKVMIEYSD